MDQGGLGGQGTINFSFGLLACRLRYQVRYLAITADAGVSSVRIHVCKVLVIFVFIGQRTKERYSSL